ncbi:hypothetical protein BDQ17DRAFT_146835 [Cyathus striatus]|nr:hypothetical protein BDQ17DRAFT_146835 [Cyathus striatus]
MVPITLEWLFTTGVFLLFFSLDTYQDNSQVKLPWLFHVDLSYAIWKRICNLFGITNPTFYSTEVQRRRQSSVANKHLPIRCYDLLVTLSTTVVGMTKSILAYQGRNTAVTAIEWVGTVVLGVGLYWLGLYASNPIGLMPYLFTTDYSDNIKANLASPYNPISFLPQLGIMALAC